MSLCVDYHMCFKCSSVIDLAYKYMIPTLFHNSARNIIKYPDIRTVTERFFSVCLAKNDQKLEYSVQ